MNSSVSSRTSKQGLRVTTSKQVLKSELDKKNSKAENEKIKKTKQRSSSLSKEQKAQESPRKSQSVDRNIAKRYNSQNISSKKSVIESKKTDIGTKKTTSSSTTSKNQNTIKSKNLKTHSSSSSTTKPSERVSRLPMKGPSGKTNVEIAKSFVQNATGKKSKKETKNNSSKISEKFKSNAVLSEETERPRTSTIRKGVSKNDHIFKETNEREIENEKSLKHLELETKHFDSKSTDEEDDKVSYEEDFEDYDSDFEDSESDSFSVSESSKSMSEEEEMINQNVESIENNAFNINSELKNSTNFSSLENISQEQKHEHPDMKKKNEKTFLRMSDRSFLTNQASSETSVEKKIIKPSHSFINFASAVEQEEKEKCSNKLLKRASDLLEIITLNDVIIQLIDIPPMKYDTFIRFFGKNNAKQVFVQTENVDDEETQTDYIETVNKWTQNPSYDNFGCGGDISTNDAKEDVTLKSLFHSQNVKLSSFFTELQ